jgi:hypothetical protein
MLAIAIRFCLTNNASRSNLGVLSRLANNRLRAFFLPNTSQRHILASGFGGVGFSGARPTFCGHLRLGINIFVCVWIHFLGRKHRLIYANFRRIPVFICARLDRDCIVLECVYGNGIFLKIRLKTASSGRIKVIKLADCFECFVLISLG